MNVNARRPVRGARGALLCTSLALIFVAGSDPLSAQSRGGVAGVVRADDGGPLAGVAVQVERTALGGLTDAQGRYRIDGVPVGERMLVARAVGYGTTQSRVEVRARRDGATRCRARAGRRRAGRHSGDRGAP